MIGDEFTDFIRLATGTPTIRTVVDTILTGMALYCTILLAKEHGATKRHFEEEQ